MSKVLTSLPVGERVGIAFSGGLDTSVAVAWMRDKGAIPCTYTADLGQYDEPTSTSVPGGRRSTAPSCRAWSTARRRSSRRACTPSRAGRSTSAPAASSTSTPRPWAARSPAPCWCGPCAGRGRHLGRRLDLQGQRHRAVLPLRPLANPNLRIYKPWLDADFVGELGGRNEMSTWLAAHGLPYRDSVEKAYSTDANIWGATHEAKRLEHLDVDRDRRADHGREVLGPRRRIDDRGRDDRLPRRAGRSPSTGASSPPRSSSCTRRTPSAAGTASAWPTRSRTASSRPRAAASTRRRAWPCCSRLRAPLNAIHNEDTIANYHTEGRRLGRLLYEGRWLDPQALMLRESLMRWVAVGGDRRGHAAAAPRRRLLDHRHPRPEFSYHPDRLSMERTEDAAFGPVDRIGQLTMRNLDIADTRASSSSMPRRASSPAGTPSSSGSSSPVARRPIAANPQVAEEGEERGARPGRDGAGHRLTGGHPTGAGCGRHTNRLP